jgi:hypothetical protein
MRLPILLVPLALALASCASSSEGQRFHVLTVVLEGPREIAEGLCDVPGACVVPTTRIAALRLDARVTVFAFPGSYVSEGVEAFESAVMPVRAIKDVQRADDGSFQPVHEEVEEGLWIRATPTRASGGRIEIEGDVRTRDVLRPIRETSVRPEGSDVDHTVQMLEWDDRSWKGGLRLLPSESLVVVLDAPATETEKRVRIVALSCETVLAP